jgi:hypothetical protein
VTITYQHNALVRAVVDLVDQLIHPHVHLLLALGRGHPPVGRGSGSAVVSTCMLGCTASSLLSAAVTHLWGEDREAPW